jgi:hypothetical protein
VQAARGPRVLVPHAGHSEPMKGKRSLVVEDEPLIALDIVAGLESAGISVVGPVGSVFDAIRAIDRDFIRWGAA